MGDEQPYKYNTLATTPTATVTTGVVHNNNNNNTLPSNKTNGFATAAAVNNAPYTAAAAAPAAVPAATPASHIDKSTGQPVPAPRRTNSVPLGDGDAAVNGAASTTSSGDSGEAQVRCQTFTL